MVLISFLVNSRLLVVKCLGSEKLTDFWLQRISAPKLHIIQGSILLVLIFWLAGLYGSYVECTDLQDIGATGIGHKLTIYFQTILEGKGRFLYFFFSLILRLFSKSKLKKKEKIKSLRQIFFTMRKELWIISI